MYLNLLLCAVFSGLAPKEKLDGLLKTVDEKLDPSLVALGNNSGYDDLTIVSGTRKVRPRECL